MEHIWPQILSFYFSKTPFTFSELQSPAAHAGLPALYP